MGFWVSTGNIQRLIAKLDWKFSDAQIDKIRSNPVRMARFDPAQPRNLRNIARLMRIWPGSGPTTTDAMKWWGFLAWLHNQTNAATGNTTIGPDIRSEIFNALNHRDCASISFVAVEGTDVRLTTSQIRLAPRPAYILVVVLQTVAHGDDRQSDPGPNEGNDSEDGSSEDLKNVGFAKPSQRKTGAAKKKTSKKKVVKKTKGKKKRAR